jgi:ABC-2 type transport system ATP-binding protein
MVNPVISVERVTKRFSGHIAVRELSLSVPAGGIFGLLGPNGAGKTTTIRMLLSILTPDEGRVVLLGQEGAGRRLSERIGYLPEERGLYPKMRVLDQLAFLGEAKGLSRWDARRRARSWLERLGLEDWIMKKVTDLSKGMQQKVQFAGALDEPFAGLDPVNSQVMREVVLEVARSGRTVLFSTHIMEHAEKMCDRIVIIARGQKIVDGTLAEVKHEGGKTHVALTFTRNAQGARTVLADRELVQAVDDAGATAEVQLAPGADAERLLRALVAADVGLARFEVIEPSLHSIFIAKVGPDAAHPEARAGVA